MDTLQARPERAFIARNVRFEPGRVRSRDGFAARFASAGKVTSFHQWQTSQFNRVIFYDGNKVRSLNLVDGVVADMFTQAARGAVVSESGSKAFISTYTDTGVSAGPVRISVGSISATEVDMAFAPPWTFVPVMADAGAGNVSEGVHRFGYIVETRTGFVGKPSPVNVFDAHAPVSFTVASGGRALTMGLTLNTPADAAFVHPIMTRVDNPDRWYFVPGAATAVPGGALGWVISIPIDISDERLADSAEEANDQFDALAQTLAGASPIGVSSVAAYGNRQVYIADNKAYFSEPDDYQYITEAGHVVQTQGQRRIVSGGTLRESFYMIGPSWTHAVSDNGDLPSTWASPTEVSGSIGTPAVQGVEWRTAGEYAWVASPSGFYLFTGQYGSRPISYYQTPEWERINWAAPYAVQVRDDYVDQKVYVSVALDANTEASNLLVWDYARGMTPEDVDFVLYNLPSNFSGLGLVQTHDTRETQLWIGPSTAGQVLRRSKGSHVDYNGQLVASVYETGLILGPADRSKRINQFGGIGYAIEGSGTLTVTVFGPDRVRQILAETQTLSVGPGQTFERKLYCLEENISIRFEVSGAGSWFDLTSLRVYWKPYATNYATEA